jgi:hypothetical protein
MMKRHLGKPAEIELDNGDTIMMAPLTIGDIPELINLQSEMVSATEGEKVYLKKEVTESAIDLIRKSILAADKSLEKDKEVVDGFIAVNFLQLMPKLFEINTLASGRDKIKAEKIARMKERVDGSGKGSSSEGKEGKPAE